MTKILWTIIAVAISTCENPVTYMYMYLQHNCSCMALLSLPYKALSEVLF